ncbi:MAG TPA: TIGR03435 family protein, partial [Terracidiphilus sp.]
FEVAVIKPSAPDEKPMGRIAGDEVNVRGFPLKRLITIAWDLDPNDKGEIVGAPKWLDAEKIDVHAKVATDNMVDGPGKGGPPISIDDLRAMLRALLIDRFEMKVRMENEPADAYDLVAVKPKLTVADPKSRTGCKEGPGPDGNDPRLGHPILNMLVTCQNVTMAQAVEEFPTFAAYYLYYPPADKTGLKGGWTFTLSWSSGDNMPGFSGGGGSPDSQNAGKASEPNGALSFYDAVSKELGLKLVKVKRPEPVLVIDHIDEQPTPN